MSAGVNRPARQALAVAARVDDPGVPSGPRCLPSRGVAVVSPEEFEALATALLPHSWEYPGSFDECGAYVGSQGAYVIHLADELAATVEAIVARRVAAALTEAAYAIEALLSDPDRRRPLAPDAELATDFANDIQWAAIVVRGLVPPP